MNSTDAYGNSNESAELSFRTLAPPDNTAPVIEFISLYPANTTAGSLMNLTVLASDNTAVTEVTANGTALTNTDGAWRGTITAPSTFGNYSLIIQAKDAANNTAVTSIPYRVLLRHGGVGVSVSPNLNNVLAGNSVNTNIVVKNTQNVDDEFKVFVYVNDLPMASQANIRWFNWTEKVVTIGAGQTMNIPLSITVPVGTTTGIKGFRAGADSQTTNVFARATGYIKIS